MTYEPIPEERVLAAFNRGADARIAGDGLGRNPYDRWSEFSEWKYWRDGWITTHLNWGKDVHGWRLLGLRALPAVPPVPTSLARLYDRRMTPTAGLEIEG